MAHDASIWQGIKSTCLIVFPLPTGRNHIHANNSRFEKIHARPDGSKVGLSFSAYSKFCHKRMHAHMYHAFRHQALNT